MIDVENETLRAYGKPAQDMNLAGWQDHPLPEVVVLVHTAPPELNGQV